MNDLKTQLIGRFVSGRKHMARQIAKQVIKVQAQTFADRCIEVQTAGQALAITDGLVVTQEAPARRAALNLEALADR
jgi:hypothetical protein